LSAGFKDYNLQDQPGRISKDTSSGFVAVKPDFAWHILELSLPPRTSLPSTREILERTFEEVDEALEKSGLKRFTMSCLPQPTENVELVGLDRMADYTCSVRQSTGDNPFVDPL